MILTFLDWLIRTLGVAIIGIGLLFVFYAAGLWFGLGDEPIDLTAWHGLLLGYFLVREGVRWWREL